MTPRELTALLGTQPRRVEARGRPAAVLVPVAFANNDARLLFTKRPDGLGIHGGQVSFPGGGVDASDRDATAAALRESQEELGLDPGQVQVLGLLDDLITITGFTITPVVGIIPAEPVLNPSPVEVEDWFWVDVERLRDPRQWRVQHFTFEGRERNTWFFEGARHTIWGATASIVRQLLRLGDELPPDVAEDIES